MAVWPTTLPGMRSGLTDKRQDTTIRSSVDVGPPLVRNRYTAAIRTIKVPVGWTQAERVIFDAFFVTTLVNGSLSFDWTDPATDLTAVYRIVTYPELQGENGGDFRRWNGTLELEILP